LEVGDTGLVGPEKPPFPAGASTFADPEKAPLSGHYFRLAKGTRLPDGFGVVADGKDVRDDSPHEEGHHTICPAAQMTPEQFTERFLRELKWEYAGNKKKKP